MTTDFKNNTPFLLGLLFFALVTAHEVEHITEAFEIADEAFEIGCEYCEENQSQNSVNSKTNITFIDFEFKDEIKQPCSQMISNVENRVALLIRRRDYFTNPNHT